MMSKDYDVVVIGAGIHGAGAAQAAAAAGYSVLVLEQQAVAYGTSSRSSKLIHGGLRYLESAQFLLVRESLRERTILLRIAPDLVRLVPFLIPVYGAAARAPWKIRAGLGIYTLLGGLKRANRFESVDRGEWGKLDGLTTNGLRAVFRYWDGQTDDAALTRAVLSSAQSLGAEFCCPAPFVAARREGEGYRVSFKRSGASADCVGRTVVNAAGPWANDVLTKVTPAPRPVKIDLVQGSHILVDGKLNAGVYYLESPRDHRAVFAMPSNDRTLIGTTERMYHGDPAAVQALPEEVQYLRETFRHYFPDRAGDVRESFAGLRVLPPGGSSLFHRPRETVFACDDRSVPRLITLYGGKLTGYRATAIKVLAQLRPALPQRRPKADTAILKLYP